METTKKFFVKNNEIYSFLPTKVKLLLSGKKLRENYYRQSEKANLEVVPIFRAILQDRENEEP